MRHLTLIRTGVCRVVAGYPIAKDHQPFGGRMELSLTTAPGSLTRAPNNVRRDTICVCPVKQEGTPSGLNVATGLGTRLIRFDRTHIGGRPDMEPAGFHVNKRRRPSDMSWQFFTLMFILLDMVCASD